MRISKATIGVFSVILFVLAVVSMHVSSTSKATTTLGMQPKNSNVLIADGGDPLPKPWHKLAA
jgi:hypothetical protein